MNLAKKNIKVVVALMLVTLTIAVVACVDRNWKADRLIHVVNRDNVSGTRKSLESFLYGSKHTPTLPQGDGYEIVPSESAMLASVRSNPQAIGYEGFGFVKANPNGIKTLSLEGVAPTVENIKNNEYKMARPLNVVHRDDRLEDNQAAAEFLKYMLSSDGQQVVEYRGYITNDELEEIEYTPLDNLSGEIIIRGSTTVEPLMQRLAEAFNKIEGYNVTFNISAAGSGDSVDAMKDNSADFGMYSSVVSESVLEDMQSGRDEYIVTVSSLARDAIVFIVHTTNSTDNVRQDQLYNLYDNTGTRYDNWQQMLDYTPEETK
ncbi:MAG: substrate-binding domain-containing protein [Clostridiales bacterium]|nr:substrate-binding domain-containing protein [Clostridiales bacterium]